MKTKVKVLTMRVTVRSSKIFKGVNQMTGEPYCFSSVLVIKDDGIHADYVNVDESVCKPELIKPGVVAEMCVASKNEKQVLIFDIKKSAADSNDTPNVSVDVSTGEIIEENPPLPEPPVDYSGDKTKKNKS